MATQPKAFGGRQPGPQILALAPGVRTVGQEVLGDQSIAQYQAQEHGDHIGEDAPGPAKPSASW